MSDRHVFSDEEPTEEMILAGAKAAVDQHYYKADAWDRGYVSEDCKKDWLNSTRFAWKAMRAIEKPIIT